MAVQTHPTADSLAAFARGDLPPTELSSVAEHVAGCQTCLASLQRLPDDSLATLARAAARPSAAGVTAFDTNALTGTIPEALATHPRYKILSELGSGGMGVVYKAEDQIMGRTVALKVMTPELTAKANAVERFRKEVRAAAKLIHPNIVTAFDAGEAGGRHFLVMEFVEGVSLDRYVVRKGPLPVHLAALFAGQAALGLQHAHERGMVHRDIKPQNLMITRKRHLKVMDFGLARFASTDEDEPTPSGRLPFGAAKPVVDAATNPNLLLGTPDYLSPEQARNSHDVDTRSDIYSLGCTLYFLLTGRPPFVKAESLIDKLLAHTEEPPPPVREVRPDVPPGLADVLAKMMAKKPADRYATPAQVAAALEPFAHKGGSIPEMKGVAGFEVIDAVVITPVPAEAPAPVRAANAFDFDTPAAAAQTTLAEPERPRKKKPKKVVPWWKRKWAAIGAGVLAVAVVVGAVIAASGRKKENPPAGGDDTAKGNVTPNPQPQPKAKGNNPWITGGSTKELKVLFVVPSQNLYGMDYFKVAPRLIQAGVKVDTASGQGGTTTLYLQKDEKRFPVDMKLADVNLSDYAAVVFCGADAEEYVDPENPAALVVKQMIATLKQQEKPIAGICKGQLVLARHGVLKGKTASRSLHLFRDYAGLAAEPGITWKTTPVEVDGNVITVGQPDDGDKLADAILKAIKAD
jgi:serine/threonine-protein kinase